MREASGSDPTTHALLETMQEIIESYYEFVEALGVQEHVEQMTWELLQSEHSLFCGEQRDPLCRCRPDTSASTRRRS